MPEQDNKQSIHQHIFDDQPQQDAETAEKQRLEDELNQQRQKLYGPGPSGTGPEEFAKGAQTGRFEGTNEAAPAGQVLDEALEFQRKASNDAVSPIIEPAELPAVFHTGDVLGATINAAEGLDEPEKVEVHKPAACGPSVVDSPEVRRAVLKQELGDADSTGLDLLSMASYRADELAAAIDNSSRSSRFEFTEAWECEFMDTLSNACGFTTSHAEFCANMVDVIALALCRQHEVNHVNFFKAIIVEFAYQQNKWGDEFDRKNTANDWVSYIIRYYSRVLNSENREQEVNAFVKVAALGYAGAIATKRLGGPAPRHYDEPPADPCPLVEKDEQEKTRQKYAEDGTPIAH